MAACVPDDEDSANAIRDHWLQRFAELSDGTRLLDVATGNGVVLVHAASAARGAGRCFELTGVDLAEIDPFRFVPGLREQLGEARFLGRVAAERLPFEPDSFDVVVSQYGLEYAPLAPALAEAARVLLPGGSLNWLAHGENSIVVAQNRGQLDEIEHMLGAEGPLSAMREVITALQRGRKLKRAVDRLDPALRRSEQFCAEHPPATMVRQICSSFVQVVRNAGAYSPAAIEHMLEHNVEAMRGHRQRIRELLAARLTPARQAEVQSVLEGPDWRECRLTDLHVAGGTQLVGVAIAATRR